MLGHEQDYLFIIWAYAGVALVTIAVIAWTWAQSVQVKRRLAQLEAQGVRRRSTGASA